MCVSSFWSLFCKFDHFFPISPPTCICLCRVDVCRLEPCIHTCWHIHTCWPVDPALSQQRSTTSASSAHISIFILLCLEQKSPISVSSAPLRTTAEKNLDVIRASRNSRIFLHFLSVLFTQTSEEQGWGEEIITLEWPFDEAQRRHRVATLVEESHFIFHKSELPSRNTPASSTPPPHTHTSNSFAPLFVRQSDVTVESRQCRVTLVIWDGGRKHPRQRESQWWFTSRHDERVTTPIWVR